jgi:hypothetical protein
MPLASSDNAQETAVATTGVCQAKDCKDWSFVCRVLPSGWVIHLVPQIYNVRLVLENPLDNECGCYTDGWCYDRSREFDARLAAATWDGQGDPPGLWKKHIRTGRQGPRARRRGGRVKCKTCDQPTFEELCVYCSGSRVRPASRIMSYEEWRSRVAKAGIAAEKFVATSKIFTAGPGEAALGLMLSALYLVHQNKELPSFEWYAEQVSKLGRSLSATPGEPAAADFENN